MEQERTYVTMADKSIGKCASGHWLPLKGDCDLCGASPNEKCRYIVIAQMGGGEDEWPARIRSSSRRKRHDRSI